MNSIFPFNLHWFHIFVVVIFVGFGGAEVNQAAEAKEPGIAKAAKETGETKETNTVSRFDEKAFKIISERNIFNQSRSGRSSKSVIPANDSPKPMRTESFALAGTMLYNKGNFAFFTSSDSSYQKTLKTGDTVASYKVTEISPDLVKMELNGKQIEMRVGMEMKKKEEGEWVLSAAENRGESGSSSGKKEASSEPSAADDEILKRLMKKREQEMNK